MANRMLVTDYAGVTVVTFTDSSILDSAAIDQLGKDLYALPDAQNKQKLILDFTRVKTLSSRALGLLINLKKKMLAIKGDLALCGMNGEIKKMFSITGLEKEFSFYADDAAALKAFNVHLR